MTAHNILVLTVCGVNMQKATCKISSADVYLHLWASFCLSASLPSVEASSVFQVLQTVVLKTAICIKRKLTGHCFATACIMCLIECGAKHIKCCVAALVWTDFTGRADSILSCYTESWDYVNMSFLTSDNSQASRWHHTTTALPNHM